MVRAVVPRMALDELFEQKGEVAKAVLEELEKVIGYLLLFRIPCFYKFVAVVLWIIQMHSS